jgi:hypothetical protein
MAHEAQPGLLAGALAEQPGLGIRGRGMGVVAPLLAVEVPAAVAAARRWLVGAILRAEALHRCPRLDQRAIDRKMLPTQELPNLRLVEHRRQEPGRGFALEQPVAVGRERGRVHTGSSIPSPTNQRNSRL